MGKIDTIVVKDLSRFGRNYIQVSQYTDYIFPAYNIRFIAISDNVDTADKNSSGMDMMPIMNVFNEWHSANTSKKIRAVLEASQKSWKYTSGWYPYGYLVGTDENRTAIIDEPAAAAVRRIFDLRIQGNSPYRIARILTAEGIRRIKKYGRCEELTREICLQLIEFITIDKKGKHDNRWYPSDEVRNIHIYYKLIDNVTAGSIKNNKN